MSLTAISSLIERKIFHELDVIMSRKQESNVRLSWPK